MTPIVPKKVEETVAVVNKNIQNVFRGTIEKVDHSSDAFNKARLECEPSRKRRRKEIKAERQSEGDPAIIGGYRGPWADYEEEGNEN